MNNLWIHQVYNYGLGNFINLTPTIKLMAEHFDKPIPVYFDLDFIRQCFTDCEFMRILDKKPDQQSLFGSWLINARNDCPDYINVLREVRKAIPLEGDLPHTYVDQAEEIKINSSGYTLFIRGSGSESLPYLESKMPEDDYYREYFGGRMIFTGSENDLERSGDLFKDMVCHVGDIRQSLALIRDADRVITNDSGLAHAAGAMNKETIILWKNTSLPKNGNPGKRTLIKLCT